MKESELILGIKKYKLQPSSRRQLSLFSSSCVALGYCEYLNDLAGFNYNAWGALGDGRKFISFVNEEDISEKTELFLEKSNNLEEALRKSNEIFSNSLEKFSTIDEKVDLKPYEYLQIIIDIYPYYFSSLGFFNCLWRLSKYKDITSYFDNALLKKIGENRNIVSSLYPKIEKILKLVFDYIGKDLKIKSDLLFFLSFEEAKILAKTKILASELKEELKRRAVCYFHFYTPENHKEHIFTNPSLIHEIKNNFINQNTESVTTLKGLSAYPGKVRGTINNAGDFSRAKHCQGGILVAYHTHPQYISIIKESAAIISDEGGLLSHAAIIARELKIPCIVGTKIATKVLKDGDMVEVDADRGIVTILSN